MSYKHRVKTLVKSDKIAKLSGVLRLSMVGAGDDGGGDSVGGP